MHLFLSFPPRYSISKAVGILKSISASRVFQEHPEVKRELWGGANCGKTAILPARWGDKVIAEIIKRYIRYHRQEKKRPQQLDLFDG